MHTPVQISHSQNQHILTIAHVNICSLRNKVHYIHRLVHDHEIHILSVNETHLDSTVSDFSLNVPGYTLYRRDRDLHGGGVCIYVHSQLHAITVPTTSNELECLFVQVRIPTKPNRTDIVVGSVYRPPSSHVDFWEKLSDSLEKATSRCKQVLVFGDLNVNVLKPCNSPQYQSSAKPVF